jgi:epoxyqueuosine reductase
MFAGSPVKRAGRDRFLRNVLIAIGNAAPGDPQLTAAARHCLDDTSPLVRATAVWAFARLVPQSLWSSERDGRLGMEQETIVREEWLQPLGREDRWNR